MKSQLHLKAIAVKEFAVPADWLLTASLTARLRKIATCQLHMRNFKDGETIYIEPFRAKAFPIIKDLTVDRSAFDRIIQAGGFISVNTGGVPDANSIPISKEIAAGSN